MRLPNLLALAHMHGCGVGCGCGHGEEGRRRAKERQRSCEWLQCCQWSNVNACVCPECVDPVSGGCPQLWHMQMDAAVAGWEQCAEATQRCDRLAAKVFESRRSIAPCTAHHRSPSANHPAMHISPLRSLSHPLHAPANPVAARVAATMHAPALRSSAEHLGEEAGREAVALMHATHIQIEVTMMSTRTQRNDTLQWQRTGPVLSASALADLPSLPPLRPVCLCVCALSRRRSG